MVWGNSGAIVEGSDVCMDISHWKKSKGVVQSNVLQSILDVDKDVEVEPDYKVYLLELHALFVTEYENEVNDDVQEEDYDPDYKLFLENLKCHGNAYVLETATNNGNKIIKYEDEGEDEHRSPNGTRRKSRYSQRKSLKKKRHHFGAKDADSLDQKLKLGTGKEKINEEYSMFLRHLSITEESFVFEDEDGNRIRYEESCDESSLSASDAKDADSLDQKLKLGTGKEKINEEYSMFLRHLSITEESFVFEDEDGNRIRYEESCDESSLSDSDVKQPAKVPRISSERTPSARKKTLGGDKVPFLDQKSVVRSSSGFRQGAMDVLQKPYDREERRRLLKEAEERKPISRLRQTRNQISVYADENELGKSFLDHHVDLKKMIKAAKHNGSSHEALYLLRGLFYYLEHVPDDGKFCPWKDAMWMEEMKRKLQHRV